MKSIVSDIRFIVLFLFIVGFTSNCTNSKTGTTAFLDNSVPLINPSDGEVSRLEVGKVVKFPAVLVRSIGSNCVELFDEKEFKKYNGDSKWAILSKFKEEPKFFDFLLTAEPVVVTGKMIRVVDSHDTDITCDIATGNLFEISEAEKLTNDQR